MGIYVNAQLLADEFANNGYLTIIPDLFQGDQVSVSDMQSGKADLAAWLPNHQPANIEPVVESTIKYARETLGVKKIGAAGYCFGGKVCTYSPDLKIQSPENITQTLVLTILVKYVCRNLKPGQIDVGYTAHPSFITHEELSAIKGPFSISAAGKLMLARSQFEKRSIKG